MVHIVIAGDYPRDPEICEISSGVEAVVLYLSQALQEYRDLKVSVVTLDKWGLGKRTIKQKNATIYYLPCVRLPSYAYTLANVLRLKKQMLILQPDLIHAQVAGMYASAAARTKLPWVLTLHGIRFLESALWESLKSRIYRGWLIKREEFGALKSAKHLISISPFIQSTFEGHLNGKMIYNIENPASDSFFRLRRNYQKGRLLFVGRMIIRKGVHTLLRAFAKVHKRFPEATLRLAGGGILANDSVSYYNDLKKFVHDAGLGNAVTFLGDLGESDLLREYSQCFALVLSSVLETAPMVIMEAMAAGKAVVSTDVGGVRYLVEHESTGIIVPPNDGEALAEALLRILSDENESKAMGQRARKLAKKSFHAEVIAARTRDVYYDVLGRMPPKNLHYHLDAGKNELSKRIL